MRENDASLAPLVLAAVAAFFFFALALTGPLDAAAGPASEPCTPPRAAERPSLLSEVLPQSLPAKPCLDSSDEIAALEAVHIALTQLSDGATYIWHRRGGHLSGIIRATSSFREPRTGRICRHLVMALTAGPLSRTIEGIACRDADGVWSLGG
jgi:surface antigen